MERLRGINVSKVADSIIMENRLKNFQQIEKEMQE